MVSAPWLGRPPALPPSPGGPRASPLLLLGSGPSNLFPWPWAPPVCSPAQAAGGPPTSASGTAIHTSSPQPSPPPTPKAQQPPKDRAGGPPWSQTVSSSGFFLRSGLPRIHPLGYSFLFPAWTFPLGGFIGDMPPPGSLPYFPPSSTSPGSVLRPVRKDDPPLSRERPLLGQTRPWRRGMGLLTSEDLEGSFPL